MMRTVEVDTAPLRPLGAAMLGVAALWPLLPVGLPPCPLRSLTGIPCPLCGATRSVVALVHGDPVAALVWNPLGVLAAAVAVVLLVGLVVRRVPRMMRVPLWLPPGAMVLAWAYNLALNPHF